MYTYWLAEQLRETADEVSGISGKQSDEKHKEVRSIKYSYQLENIKNVMALTMRYLEE